MSETISSAIGEIVAVSTTTFVAQCRTDPRPEPPSFYDPPDFGSFVTIGPPGALIEQPINAEQEISDGEEDPFAAPRQILAARPTLLAPGLVYALVCRAEMVAMDGRKPLALGLGSAERMRMERPQVFELVST